MSLKDRLNAQPKAVIDKETFKAKFQENKSSKLIKTEDGLGILEPFFVDENLNSIYVSGAKNIYIEKKGIVHKVATAFKDNFKLVETIRRNALKAGVGEDDDSSYLKFNYKEGINITATLPPLSNVPIMNIKCYYDKNATMKVLQENRTISKEMAMFFETMFSQKSNILIIGNPQSLKTTMLSACAKLLGINDRGVLIDYKNEIKIKAENYSRYDFSAANEDLKKELLNVIFDSNPDRVFVNDCDEKIFYEIINRLMFGYKGAVITLKALDEVDAINVISKIIKKQNPYMDLNDIKSMIFNIFDIVITCNKDKKGQRNLSGISELKSEGNKINNIFYLNENSEHSSSGYIPDFYNLSNPVSINSNIFDKNYKHTYFKNMNENYQPCNDLIKKIQENAQNDTFENSSYNTDTEDAIKKAQEKFEELKKNAKLQEELPNKNEIAIGENQQTEQSEYNFNGQ